MWIQKMIVGLVLLLTSSAIFAAKYTCANLELPQADEDLLLFQNTSKSIDIEISKNHFLKLDLSNGETLSGHASLKKQIGSREYFLTLGPLENIYYVEDDNFGKKIIQHSKLVTDPQTHRQGKIVTTYVCSILIGN